MTDALAAAAVSPVRPGMVVGLGTGRAAARGIRALADRATAEPLGITCIATSLASAQLASSLGLTVAPLAEASHVDYLFDGADEVDPAIRMIKGRGGAMTRERIVAAMADRCVYLVDDSKLVTRLGERAPLPVEVIPEAVGEVRAALVRLGLNTAPLRAATDGSPARTDNGNMILDVPLPPIIDVDALGAALDHVPGIVDHGLFLTEASEVIVESATGLRTMRRDR